MSPEGPGTYGNPTGRDGILAGRRNLGLSVGASIARGGHDGENERERPKNPRGVTPRCKHGSAEFSACSSI